MIASSEQVYVVPRDALFNGEEAPQGCVPLDPELLVRIYRHGYFAPREGVEDDPSLKQIIPYAVVARGRQVFCFQRTDKGGEKRLFGLRSVGVGGHVNPPDKANVVLHALRREIEEELRLVPGWRAELKGLLNDDSTSVGSVHVGIVAVVEPVSGVVEVREDDTMSGSFLSRKDLKALHARERDSFESWSALLIDRLDEVLAWQPPHVSSTLTRTKTPISIT